MSRCEYAPEGHDRCGLQVGHQGNHAQPTVGVVCINRDGHRTIVRTTLTRGETRGQLTKWAAKRDRHPNAIALGMRHVIVQVVADRATRSGFTEVQP